MNIACIFKGHSYSIAQHDRPFPSFSEPIAVGRLDGSWDFQPARLVGFMSYGLISYCDRCGNEADADKLNLPTIQPRLE